MYILNNISYSNFKALILDNIRLLLNKLIYNYINVKFSTELFTLTYYPSLLSFSSTKLNNKTNTIYKPINSLLSIYIPVKLNFITINRQIKFLFNVLNIPKISSTNYLTIKGIKRIILPAFNSLFRHYTNTKDLINLFYDKTYSLKINSIKFITINLNIKGINCYNASFIDLDNYTFYRINKKEIINKTYNNIFNLELFKIFSNTITNLTYTYNDINSDSLCYKFITNSSDYIINYFRRDYNYLLFFKNNKILRYNRPLSISEILIKENILVHPLFQIVDQTNCLCELMNQYKIHMSHETIYNKFSVTRNIRLIKGDYITKISPLSTNEGESAGLISSLIHLNSLHNKKLRTALNTNNKLFNYIKFDSTSLTFNKNYLINNYNNLKKYYNINKNSFSEFGEFKIDKSINNNKSYTNLTEILSISESVIPFILNNDPCRGLMGSKMHCQSIPLIYPDVPSIFTKNNKINKITKTNCIVSYSTGIVIDVNKYKIVIQDSYNRIITYYINPIKINHYTHSLLNHVLVWPGDRVSYGKILATNKNYINLELSLGKNILIGYCNYYGNEHEDAIILKKNLLYSDYMLSIKFNIYETYVSAIYDDSFEFINTKINNYNKLLLENNIILPKIKLTLNNINNVQNISNVIVFNNYIPIIYKFIKINRGCSSRVVKIESLIDSNLNDDKPYSIKVNIITIDFNKLNVGDKLCGRHGNKGVISCILDDINIPYTSCDIIPDILVNPISSVSRINIGQILEGSCGFYTFLNKSRLNVPYFINTSKFITNFFINSLNFLYKYKLLLFLNSYQISKIFVKNPLLGSGYYNNITMYYSYYLRLSHIIKNKTQLRSIGKYNEITQQPDDSKKTNKGQRFGEMEFWALESHGSSFNIKELLYIKSSQSKYNNKLLISNSFNLLCTELNNLHLNLIKTNNDITL